MGTRADFYLGRGPSSEWLGSIAFDGLWIFENDDGRRVLGAGTEADYRAAVSCFLAARDHASIAGVHGWPWPWPSSDTSDCAYAFDDGRVWLCSGDSWDLIALDGSRTVGDGCPVEWPDMSSQRDVTLGRRSGLLVLEVP